MCSLLIINLNAAKALGTTVLQSLMLRADEVIRSTVSERPIQAVGVVRERRVQKLIANPTAKPCMPGPNL